MKCLHVVNISFVLPYYIGGQFDFLRDKGVSFYVACTPSEFLNQYAEEKNFFSIPITVAREINIIKDVKSVFELVRVIRKNKIDVVIGHTPKGGLLAMTASYLAGRKNRIYFRHGLMYETSKGMKKVLLKSIEKLTGMLASKVVCVSPSVLEISNREALSDAGKNIILNRGTCNGIDLRRFNKTAVCHKRVEEVRRKYGINSDKKIIGYVGRLVNDKGINELVGGWRLLREKYSDIILLLAGPFEDRDSLPERTKEVLRNDESIICTGLIDEVELFYSMMDFFILPSYREGFPTVVLEASAMELPVLTTRVTGCCDSIRDGETGCFIENDPTDIANKMKYYLDNPEIAKEHGRNGRIFVEKNFQQEIIWNDIASLIFNLDNHENHNNRQ
ncbi:glycosyltransferase family 4 protein [Filimonas effusa]|uniref:Glycosyltransferase family 1 protein n=1 Tax=Filimonas effusa TaxID=2508721 RepID=A0A4Q1D3F6_9BACT|nr:glycosyltransferase family 4 protein [Filimonas effusa]RXK81839.1 glycosyltransferase family 1 protein [Filimonas effusa]